MRGRSVTLTWFTADKILKNACDRVGLVGVSTHSFRRTALTQMSSAGVPLRVIQEISGHSDLGTLQRYLEVTLEQKRKAIEAIGFDQGCTRTIGFQEFSREILYRFSNASNSTLNSLSKVLCQTWGAISISTPNYLAFADTDIPVFNSKNPHMGNSVFRDAITIFKSWEKTVHSQLDVAVNQSMSLFTN